MKLRKLRSDMKLKGKRVLVRIDANVPIKNGRAVDGPHGRIARAAVNLDWLLQRGARVIVLTHLGRPNGRRSPALSVQPVAKRLSGLLSFKVHTTRKVVGPEVVRAVEKLNDGELLLLENVRFDRREMVNDPIFAEALSKLGDLYVNDAFSVCHRAHASIDAITDFLPSYAGPLVVNEVNGLSRLDKQIKHPFVLIMGGLKIETKLPVIQRFYKEADHVLIGGALATTFFASLRHEIGRSVHDKDMIATAKREFEKMKDKIVLPSDVVVSTSLRKDARHKTVAKEVVGMTDRIVDIGPEATKEYKLIIASAKTIVWNGPLGYSEIPAFGRATREIAKAISARTGKAVTIVGGGDTGSMLESLGLADKFTHLSTGGGALLEFMAGKKLPGLEALKI
jgi:3-phosphoglycerate kinase